VTPDEHGSATMEGDIGSFEIGLSSSETFYFGSLEDNPSFILFDDFIVKKCLLIVDDNG
jgi:hypothetical protein